MSRNPQHFRAFVEADALVDAIYAMTASLPEGERYGLQAQLRRAAVSVSTNIVEGSTRDSTADYSRFLQLARGSAAECEYLLTVARRLGFASDVALALASRYRGLSVALRLAIVHLRTLPR